MNPDLAMGDELLKKTGAGNLFMVFGEPDIDDRAAADGEARRSRSTAWMSTTRPPAQIRSHSTDDIACWFIDTDYNGESFFVRHAYFTGADEPYDKLKRALRAEIDEAAWATLYSTVSRPFAAPETGQDRREGHQPLRRRGAEGVRRAMSPVRAEFAKSNHRCEHMFAISSVDQRRGERGRSKRNRVDRGDLEPGHGLHQISPGCEHCYAETFAERWRGVPGHPYEQGLRPAALAASVWSSRCGGSDPRTIFVNSMSDLFHEDVPLEFIQRVFDVMERADWHTFQVLTKRPDRLPSSRRAALACTTSGWASASRTERYVHRADHLRRSRRRSGSSRASRCSARCGP